MWVFKKIIICFNSRLGHMGLESDEDICLRTDIYAMAELKLKLSLQRLQCGILTVMQSKTGFGFGCH